MKVKYESTILKMEELARQIIQKIAASQKLPYRLVQRAQAIELLAQGERITHIAQEVNLNRNNISKWRSRFEKNLEQINELAKENRKKECEELIIDSLSDQKRSGRPRKFTTEDRDAIIAIACTDPRSPEIDWPISQWSATKLSFFLTERSIIPDISRCSVYRVLKENKLQPHKQEMWLNSPDKYKNFDEFIDKIREVSSIISSAQSLYENGIQIISIDEKPGIQVLKPVRPDHPMLPGMCVKREMFYERIGRIDLIQSMNVAMGDLFEPYLSAHHREEDFLAALQASVQAQLEITPDDEIIVICDNLNTHKSESVVRYIASLLNIEQSSLGKKGTRGVLENMKTRNDFLCDPSHKIRFVYTPKHCSWLDPIEVYFSILNRDLLEKGIFISPADVGENIMAYTQWYNEHSARPFEYHFSDLEEKIANWEMKQSHF